MQLVSPVLTTHCDGIIYTLTQREQYASQCNPLMTGATCNFHHPRTLCECTSNQPSAASNNFLSFSSGAINLSVPQIAFHTDRKRLITYCAPDNLSTAFLTQIIQTAFRVTAHARTQTHRYTKHTLKHARHKNSHLVRGVKQHLELCKMQCREGGFVDVEVEPSSHSLLVGPAPCHLKPNDSPMCTRRINKNFTNFMLIHLFGKSAN